MGFEQHQMVQVLREPHEANGKLTWSRLSEQFFRVDKWSVCRG
jgi:hypothetical protein